MRLSGVEIICHARSWTLQCQLIDHRREFVTLWISGWRGASTFFSSFVGSDSGSTPGSAGGRGVEASRRLFSLLASLRSALLANPASTCDQY